MAFFFLSMQRLTDDEESLLPFFLEYNINISIISSLFINVILPSLQQLVHPQREACPRWIGGTPLR
jgi:hypothetical protein